MTAYLLTNHLLNFMLPAAVVALLLVLMSRIFSRFLGGKKPVAQRWWVQAAIVFAAGVAILVAGLVVFGTDAKMLTYTALVIGAALCQWFLLRAWKR